MAVPKNSRDFGDGGVYMGERMEKSVESGRTAVRRVGLPNGDVMRGSRPVDGEGEEEQAIELRAG